MKRTTSFFVKSPLIRSLPLGLAVLALAAVPMASAQSVLIDPTHNNGSFEFAGGVLNTAKIAAWDTTPDIDNWSEWTGESTDATDSGVENTGNASDGTMVSFMRGGNAAYNMTSYVIQQGDVFEFSWDHVLRGDRDHSVWLIYDDGGTITKIDASQTDSTGTLGTIGNSYTVQPGDAWIGSTVGIGIHAFNVNGGYPEVDNFILTVTPVPEPATFALLLMGAGAIALRRRLKA